MTIQRLKKELMSQYDYMKCGNAMEFKMRLQWLSEGMLKNQLTNVDQYVINDEEIKLYKEFCEKRNNLLQK